MTQAGENCWGFNGNTKFCKDFKGSNCGFSAFDINSIIQNSCISNKDIKNLSSGSKPQRGLRSFETVKFLKSCSLRLTPRLAREEFLLDHHSKICKEDSTLHLAENFMFGINGKMQNYEEAFSCFSRIKKDEQSSCVLGLLGFCYEFGIGCKKNYKRCLSAYELANIYQDALTKARLYDLGGFKMIGEAFQNEVYKELEEAAKLAKKNQTESLPKKISIPDNRSKNSKQESEFAQGPLKWLWGAANNYSNAYAQYALGNCFYYGAGTTHNIQLAIKWYWRSTLQGCGRAELSLGMCYLRGIGVKKNEKAAFRLLTQAVAKGETFSIHELGACYENGLIIPQNYEKARNLYVLAAHDGHWPSATKLGHLYKNGIGVVRDPRHAAQWYHVAKDLSSEDACFYLGELYQKGIGVPQDNGIAFQCYVPAALCFHKAAINALSMMYLCGIGTTRNPDSAVLLYLYVVDKDYGAVCLDFAWRLENGIGVPVDPEGALEMIDCAIMIGYEPKEVPLLDWATSLGMQISCRRIAEAARQQVEAGMHLLASAV